MTREEEIKQANLIHSLDLQRTKDFETIPYTLEDVEYAFNSGAKWADEHPKNPWRDAKKDPPTEEGWVYVNGERLSIYYYKDNEWYDERENITFQPYYWMPIPELPKGGKE